MKSASVVLLCCLSVVGARSPLDALEAVLSSSPSLRKLVTLDTTLTDPGDDCLEKCNYKCDNSTSCAQKYKAFCTPGPLDPTDPDAAQNQALLQALAEAFSADCPVLCDSCPAVCPGSGIADDPEICTRDPMQLRNFCEGFPQVSPTLQYSCPILCNTCDKITTTTATATTTTTTVSSVTSTTTTVTSTTTTNKCPNGIADHATCSAFASAKDALCALPEVNEPCPFLCGTCDLDPTFTTTETTTTTTLTCDQQCATEDVDVSTALCEVADPSVDPLVRKFLAPLARPRRVLRFCLAPRELPRQVSDSLVQNDTTSASGPGP